MRTETFLANCFQPPFSSSPNVGSLFEPKLFSNHTLVDEHSVDKRVQHIFGKNDNNIAAIVLHLPEDGGKEFWGRSTSYGCRCNSIRDFRGENLN
jgi:hypothetical protein